MAQHHYDKDGNYIGRTLSDDERSEQWRRDNPKFTCGVFLVMLALMLFAIFVLPKFFGY